jgi:hypothetical protein
MKKEGGLGLMSEPEQLVFACVRPFWDKDRGWRFTGSTEKTETSMILETASLQKGHKLLLVDDKEWWVRLRVIPPWIHKKFPYEEWWREIELAKDQGTDPAKIGEVCLVTEGGTCSCGGILHQLLIRISANFCEYQTLTLVVPKACRSAVKTYLDKVWEKEVPLPGQCLQEIVVITPLVSGSFNGMHREVFSKEFVIK